MRKRGGGTVAFVCDPLWQALVQALSAAEEAGAKAKPAKPVKIPIKGGMKTGTPQTKSVPKKTSSPKTSTRKTSSSRTSGKATSPAKRAQKSKSLVRKRAKAVVRRKGASKKASRPAKRVVARKKKVRPSI